MRNLKRVLSLTLASVMLLGMMVIGSSAATDYPDVDYDNDNVEAIEVLEAINVMTGYPEDGTFKPGNEVSRAEMARIMAALMDLEYDYYVGANPFTDMAGHWAEVYAAACAANGIIAGRTTTTYDPSATVTAVEAAAMLMRALGYFQNREVDYADGFEISTVRQAGRINLFDKVDVKTNEPMTRNDVAQLILNTLQSGMVEPDKNGTLSVTTPDGFTVATGATNYVYTVARNNTVGQAINDTTATSGNSSSGLTGFILDLGEQLYNGELKLKKDEQDVFGRPSRKWEFKGKEIGTYRKTELLEETYSVKVTGKMLYDLLGASTIDDYRLYVFIDGVDKVADNAAVFVKTDLNRTNTGTVGATGKGVTTEVYVDTEAKEITVAIINTYLAKAEDDYDEKNDELDLKVYSVTNNNTSAAPIYVKAADDELMTVSGEDFPITEAEKDDFCLVQIADGEIQTMQAPEILDSVIIDAFKTGTANDYVSTDGTQYDHASTARYDVDVLNQYDFTNLKETTYNIILDQYGYLIGLEQNSDPDQYVFLTGIDASASNLYATTANANVIHLDGTLETVKVDLTKSRNALTGGGRLTDFTEWTRDETSNLTVPNLSQLNIWCKYSVSTSGVYTLKMVPIGNGQTSSVVPTTGTKVGQFAQDVDIYDDATLSSGKTDIKEINEKRVSLVAYGNGTAGGYVYGNDDTVYINVTLDCVTVDDDSNIPGGANRWIVDDVDSITVGVKNASLEMKDLGDTKADKNGTDFYYPKHEIYTLYNDKGVVIAAVTIGDDSGSTATYAYITGNVIDHEEYGHTTAKATEGKWTWYLNAIVDGEKTQLTETGDSLDVLDTMVRGEWYEVRYDANGNVRRAEGIGDAIASDTDYYWDDTIGDTTGGNSATGGVTKFISSATNVEAALAQNNGNILLHDFSTVEALTFKAGTLYTQTNATKGFSVSPDVKVVVINANRGGNSMYDSITDGYTGWTGMTKAINDMNSHGANYGGAPTIGARGVTPERWIELSAVFTNGSASVIVINDKSPLRSGAAPTLPGDSSTSLGVFVDESSQTITANFLVGDNNRRGPIMLAAREAGIDVMELDTSLTYLYDRDLRTWVVTVNEYYTVTIDNTVYEYVKKSGADGTTRKEFLPDVGDYNGTGLIVSLNNGTSYSYIPYDGVTSGIDDGTTITNHVIIKNSYVEVTLGNASAGFDISTTADTGSAGNLEVVRSATNGVTCGGNWVMPYNGNLTVTLKSKTDNLTFTDSIRYDLTYDEATSSPVESKTVEDGGDYDTGVAVVSFTINNVKTDVSNILMTGSTTYEPHVINVVLNDTTDSSNAPVGENGLEMTIVGGEEQADGSWEISVDKVQKDKKYFVQIALSGTNTDAATNLTWTIENGDNSSNVALDPDCIIGAYDTSEADTITFASNVDYTGKVLTFIITGDDSSSAEDLTFTLAASGS